jgi:GAF domain-containing protein
MFDFTPPDPADKPRLYAEIIEAAQALVADETDPVANMANVAALIWQFLPGLNWAGFYRHIDGELVLGPFQGKPACIRIAIGKGVCGTAADTRRTIRVEDVHSFPGHIACDAASASEIVVPVIVDGRLVAVLDLDSPLPARFNQEDERGLEGLVAAVAPALAAFRLND